MSTLKSAGADLISTCFADFDGSCNVEQVQYGFNTKLLCP